MNWMPRSRTLNRESELLGAWPAVLGAIALGLVAGALTHRSSSTALILCVVAVSVLGLAMLGDRAFPFAIVIVAVVPWYPFVSNSAEPPIVRQEVLCAAIAAAP